MADRQKSTFIPFKKGNKVWLDSRSLKMIYHKKMKLKCEGPFEITEFLSPVTYKLRLPASWQIHNVFHATLLKQYKENETYGEFFRTTTWTHRRRRSIQSRNNFEPQKKRTRLPVLKATLYPTHHGNWNIHFPTMETLWHNTNNDTTSNSPCLLTNNTVWTENSVNGWI